MEKNTSESQHIIEYLKEHYTIIPEHYRNFLIRYAADKSRLNPHEAYSVNNENFLSDLKKISIAYANCNDTSLTVQRALTIIKLFNEYEAHMDPKKLIDLSLELDKLYMDSGLSVRNTDTVIRKLTLNVKGSKRNGNL